MVSLVVSGMGSFEKRVGGLCCSVMSGDIHISHFSFQIHQNFANFVHFCYVILTHR